MVVPGKGILAAGASLGTIEKRLSAVLGTERTEASRKRTRRCCFSKVKYSPPGK